MYTFKESVPLGPDTSNIGVPLEPEVAAHYGRNPHVYEYGQEGTEIPHPGNFPLVLHAYALNRFGNEAQSFTIKAYQRVLREYRYGRFITQALDAVYEVDRASIIDPALMSPLKETEETRITHAIVIEEALAYLPPDFDVNLLRDPGRTEEAA